MKRQNPKKTSKEQELIDGYYIPKEIAQAYCHLKQCCIDDLIEGYQTFCISVKCETCDNQQVVVAQNDENRYEVIITPQVVSQVEKMYGTTKWEQFLKDHQVKG